MFNNMENVHPGDIQNVVIIDKGSRPGAVSCLVAIIVIMII